MPVVLGMACAPVVYRPGSPPQRIVSTEAEVRTLLDVAKAKLNEAALAGNIEGVLDRFAPGAVVVVEGRDTLRGRASIAAWLTAHAEGKAAATLPGLPANDVTRRVQSWGTWAEVAYTRPIWPHGYVEFRYQWRDDIPVPVPGAGFFAPSRAGAGGSTYGIHVGASWW